jgi:hypothetical protein
MIATPLCAHEFVLWPVKFLALLGTIRCRICFALFTARAFLRGPEAMNAAEAAFVFDSLKYEIVEATLLVRLF